MLVTRRMHPLWIEGRRVHQVGLPYHWGYRGLVKGDVVNDLLAINEEPNVRIMESQGPGVRRGAGTASGGEVARWSNCGT